MLKAENKLGYRAFGLSILSEIPLPELLSSADNDGQFEVQIIIKDITKEYEKSLDKTGIFVVKKDLVMFQIPNVATFSIQAGNTIFVSPMNNPDEDVIRLYLLGTCMGALLMQRKILPLHGSVLAIDGKAYAIVGESGAGKSTLAAAFIKQGYKFLSDDVIAVSLTPNESAPIVTPSYPQQKLWQDSLNSFGMEKENYRPICGREDKYCVPVPANYYNDTLPLAGIFELVKTNNSEIDFLEIEKLERFETIFCNTFRNFLIPQLELLDWHLNISANIVNKIDIHRITRPASGISTDYLLSIILNKIKEGE